MSKSNFPNHSGGVIRVQHTVRWGSIPEGLLEDDRLSLDSRAVAAWIAIKPSDWQIVASVLMTRMGLGKDRWQRIARELQAAGYLTRSCRPGPHGHWQWENLFDPTGAALHGPGGNGADPAGDAAAGADNPGDKVIPVNQHHDRNTTTRVVESLQELTFPKVSQPHKQMLLRLLSELPSEAAQAIVDEFSGALEAVARGEHEAIRNPRAWVKRLVEAWRTGGFSLNLGCNQRQAAKVNAAVVASSAAAEAAAAAERAAAGLPPRQSKDEALAAIRNQSPPSTSSHGVIS
ncbi:hypothetical protein [Burkholderia sp. WAC0059]|uniref:hypothetical protein n=1 Tax=Burkholderia sp. WAC0059 TaxID=2066022 RepID=UPI0011AFC33E|nr:hypothetical protein [Burkholderia sp. WAC0059]